MFNNEMGRHAPALRYSSGVLPGFLRTTTLAFYNDAGLPEPATTFQQSGIRRRAEENTGALAW